MNRKSAIIGVLIVLLLITIVLFLNIKSNQRELENAILMNEFVEREKELRNFKVFISELADKYDVFSRNEAQSDLYWILAAPDRSIIPKVTHSIRNAEFEFYSSYSTFIIEFDSEYEGIVKKFASKFPIMDNGQLVAFSNHLVETYDLYMKSLEGWSIRSTANKLDIHFQPPIENLNQVIRELRLLREELEAL